MPGIATFSVVALDCEDPEVLADFYSAVTGWPVREPRGGDWVQLVSDVGATIACQRVTGHRSPEWPGNEHPQQLHIDLDVPDLDVGEEQVLALGARKAEHQPEPGDWRVFLDPAGHPFCLVLGG